MTAQDKIKSLVCVLTLAYCWAHLSGQWLSKIKPIKAKGHGRRKISIFALGIQTMRHTSFSKYPEILMFGCSTWYGGKLGSANVLEFRG